MTLQRFIGRDAWAQLDPGTRDNIGAIVLELVVNRNGHDANYGNGHLTLQLRPFEAADSLLEDMLMDHVQTALKDLVAAIHDDSLPIPVPSLLGAVCRKCGCSEHDACEAGCGWAEPDLCTACVEVPA